MMQKQMEKKGIALTNRLKVFVAACLLALCFGICAGGFLLSETAFAADSLKAGAMDAKSAYTVSATDKRPPFELSTGDFTFSRDTSLTRSLYVYVEFTNKQAPENRLVRASSSNPRVASVSLRQRKNIVYAQITPKKLGKTTISYTDKFKRKKFARITVKKGYFRSVLKNSGFPFMYYGYRRVTIDTLPHAAVMMRIGKEVIKGRANRDGQFKRALKNDYPIGTGYRITAKYHGVVGVSYGKVIGQAYISRIGKGAEQKISYYKNTVPVRVHYLNKGDTVILIAGGRKYTSKINGYHLVREITFHTKYPNYHYGSVKVLIKNKFGQTMDVATRSFHNAEA